MLFVRPTFLLPLLFFCSTNFFPIVSTSADQNVENSEAEQSANVLLQRPLNIIELADTDGDGRISLDGELKQFLESTKFERMFKALFDHQPRGELRLEGFRKTLTKHFEGRKYAPKLPTLVNEVNVNKNGGIDWHEFKLFMHELGKQLVDADHDGFITLTESQAFYSWEYTLVGNE
ncbi:hypothetical protein niasHT_033688 [Heterodera trifolii]|uniref:EF-hand domain-containing protein n=1 Tax=Heterodera trifolii TaxID=157864 RepID=A0ABD2I5W7_9BILA